MDPGADPDPGTDPDPGADPGADPDQGLIQGWIQGQIKFTDEDPRGRIVQDVKPHPRSEAP